ncbi:MAG: dihydrolipoyl dehydrogenase [Prevotella sp.]|nr:dihydrolipoyl dehydrogenase [Prevotella sp.]
MTTTDLIIIGAGPGGYRAAEYAAKNGLQVVVIEGRHVGGTCLNEGCIPTKAFARNAEVMKSLANADQFGFDNLHYDFDFQRVVERKNQVIETLRSGVETLLSQPGITLVKEEAAFVDAKTVQTTSGETFTAPNIIIATGSEPKSPPFKVSDSNIACDSSELLDATTLPRHLCIVGAGVIGMEFASIFNAFGCQVTVVEFLKECLPNLDSDIAKRLRKSLEKQGVEFFMQSAVTAVTSEGVTFERKGKSTTIEADKVLIAVGRKPVLPKGIETTGVAIDKTGIIVDDNMQTDIFGLYAIGDVNGRQMLAHAATMQGLRAVNHILGRPDNIRLDIMPAAIFTSPEAACVGKSEDECKAEETPYECHKGYYRANGKALAMGETEGIVKLLTDAKGRIIGCHILGAHAADMVQEVAALMNRDATIDQLRQITHIHPTLEEILQDL